MTCPKPRFDESHGARSPVALLTGGGDRPYALGLAGALISQGVALDFIGSDDLRSSELEANPLVRFLNLRRNQDPTTSAAGKMVRVLAYYGRLIAYAATSRAVIFHLLWNNKFEFFDRTILTLYYKLLGKRLTLTAHNVNKHKRDGNDSWFNRCTLRFQYRLVDHIFVHTNRMKMELCTDFGIPAEKVSVIPFGINNTVPNTALTATEARQRLGIPNSARILLFFGFIAPYKGLEFLLEALAQLIASGHDYRVIVAGYPKGADSYWEMIQRKIIDMGLVDRVIQRIEYVPDKDTELYFKAADVFVLPYTHVFQSGVLFLGYNFGLPVIASDVGSLREEIIEGETGFVFRPKDSADLLACIERFFDSALYMSLGTNRSKIQIHAYNRYSWSKVGAITHAIYGHLWPSMPKPCSSSKNWSAHTSKSVPPQSQVKTG